MLVIGVSNVPQRQPGPGEAPSGEPGFIYEQKQLIVGQLSHAALRDLSIEVDPLPVDRHGWTAPETDSLHHLADLYEEADLMVPPASASLAHRQQVNTYLRFLQEALPFSDVERWWLLSDVLRDAKGLGRGPYDEEYLDPVRRADELVMINGASRLVSGRELLHRMWSWRRGFGDFAGGEGLTQARESLAGLVELLAPDLGLPAEYETLDQHG